MPHLIRLRELGSLLAVVIALNACDDSRPRRSNTTVGKQDAASSPRLDARPTPSTPDLPTPDAARPDGGTSRDAAALDGPPAIDAAEPDTAAPDAAIDAGPVPPSTSIPAPWVFSSVGAVAPAPASGTTGRAFVVHAAGEDVWSTADSFTFTHRTLMGDGEIVAYVRRIEEIDSGSKMGVMFRESLEPGSKNVFMLATSPSRMATRLQYRDRRVNDATYFQDLTQTPVSLPVWLKLERRGNLFTGWLSTDGTTWIKDGEVRVDMMASVHVGIAASAHTMAVMPTTFESVRVTSVSSDLVHAEVRSAGGLGVGTPNQLTVEGGGGGLLGDADGVTFVHRPTPVFGDVELVGRVGLTAEGQNAFAGLMLRTSLAPGSRMIFLGLRPNGAPAVYARGGDDANTYAVRSVRVETGDAGAADAASAASPDGGAPRAAPTWFKLVRVGDRFAAFTSADGQTWRLHADATLNLAANALVGVAVTSGRSREIARGNVEKLRIVSPPMTTLPSLPDAGGAPADALP